ncbi:MAG TPA: hypothetical protein VES59_07330 [Bacteroidota bacterium]|nr:hypothetical protein [Bacteroidota bacterium]
MDGNLVETIYYNHGEIADWLNDPTHSGVWPKGTNHTYVDGVAIIVQSEVQDQQGHVFHPLETNYYEYTRQNVVNGVTYGWWPLPGYDARFRTTPAQSNDPVTWPPHWPDRPNDWDGYWNGFFGKGVLNADLESYFVFDDNEDRDYINRYSFHPDADDSSRGGLGMQVHARGFQWSQVLAEDVIFWYYEITNMGTTDYDKTLFAQYMDWGIGGHDNSSNNAGDYDQLLNLSYAWSTVQFGSPGHWSPVGYAGYAFLESPGISYDHIDNDHDGLTDERRDNNASVFIADPTRDPFLVDVQQDTARFKQFYGYSWRPHWDADENCNWRAYTDLNHNGVWDPGEPLNDDVGSDGIGPLDEGYTAPDRDGSEGDGKPEQGEPNFGFLDKDESDQLGLTGFLIANVHTYDLNNDERNWTALTSLPPPHGGQLAGVNLANYFSSYLFHLPGRLTYSLQTGQLQPTGATERFSMGLIFGLNVDDLFRRKKTVQQIYNANYNFAKPPEKPRLKAIAGDRRVTLYWDNRAEQTFDAFYQKYNFEGYKIYRSTERNFLEDKVITDAFGEATYRQPIAQFDLADGVKGFHSILVNGAAFYLGDDRGLQHSFIDSNVQNGQTYYYAVSAYDQGFTATTITGEFIGIPPTETPTIIRLDASGQLKTDLNTAIVTPRAPSAGYINPLIKNLITTGPGTGSVSIDILDPDSLLNDHTFRLEFQDSSAFHSNPEPYYRLVDKSNGDTVIPLTKLRKSPQQSPFVEGIAINLANDSLVQIDHGKSGWAKGDCNYIVQLGFDSRYLGAYGTRRVNYPADFEITFTKKDSGDIAIPKDPGSPPNPSNIIIKDLTENIDHFQFIFRDNNADSLFNAPPGDTDAVFIVCGDSAGKRATTPRNTKISWSISMFQDTSISQSQQRPPQPGDVFRIMTTKPFRTGEFYEFTTERSRVDASLARNQMANIAVVPNPYVGAASWEPFSNTSGRGERRIYFIHLPRECTIRIYTISGHLVQTLYHNGTIDDGQEPWDLLSRDGANIAYGVYAYHVDAPGVGSRIDKFAIMK